MRGVMLKRHILSNNLNIPKFDYDYHLFIDEGHKKSFGRAERELRLTSTILTIALCLAAETGHRQELRFRAGRCQKGTELLPARKPSRDCDKTGSLRSQGRLY